MSNDKLKSSSDGANKPGKEARALGRRVFGLGTGSGLIGGGLTASSICQGETHSGLTYNA